MFKINPKNFVEFPGRNFSYRGDRGTWVKAEADGTYTLFIGAGTVSSAYIAELNEFLADFGKEFSDFTCGVRHTLTPQADMKEEIIIVIDQRYGDGSWYPSMDDFRAARLAPGGWTSEDLDWFIEDASNPVEIFKAYFVRPLEDGGLLYRHETGHDPQDIRTAYYAVYDNGSAKYLGREAVAETPATKEAPETGAEEEARRAAYERAQELKTWAETTEPVTYESGNEWYPYVYAKPRISGGEAAWATYAENYPDDTGEYMGFVYGSEPPSREQLLELLEEMLANAE